MTPFATKGLLTAFWVASLLAGCGKNTAEQPWVAYHEQLATDLNLPTAIERSPPRNIGAFPDRHSRQVHVPEIRESLLNVYALRECQITSLVAARNNQLGRVAPPSQQWLYERTLWQRLSSCWNSEAVSELSDENRERLETLTLQKTAQLPAVSWNAIFESAEWEKSFSRASEPFNPPSTADFSQQLASLKYLYQMVVNQFSREWQQDSTTLENHLKTLQERPLTAEFLRSLLLAEQRLSEANNVLSEQPLSDDDDTCLQPWDDTWLTSLEQHAEQWLISINQLFDAHNITTPESIAEYQYTWLSMSNPSAPWQQFQTAQATHEQLRDRFPTCTTT